MATVLPLQRKHPPATGVALEERSDDDLMRLARGGAEPAFDVLVRRHQRTILAVAARQMTDPALAKDVAQNTFVALHRALPRYEPRGQFKPYLFELLRNEGRMAARKHRSLREDVLDRVPLPASPSISEDNLLARERKRDVDHAVSGLTEKLRDVVTLRFSGDMSHQEIAETLGVPVGTVKSRLFNALEELRRRFVGGAP